MSVGSIVTKFTLVAATAMAGIASALSAVAQPIPGYPSSVDAYDPRETAMLPPFCMYTQIFRDKVPGGSDSAKVEAWRATLGPTFNHLHHYCCGLMKTNRGVLLARTSEARVSYLNDANREFDYVTERAPADFVLLPEILTKKGQNLVRLNQGSLARFEFERAAQLKPDYWPPYAHMSDLYKSEGNMKAAREWLERGLSAAPEASALKRRLEELGQGRSATKPAQ